MLTEKQEKALKRYVRETPKEHQCLGLAAQAVKPLTTGLYRLLPIAAAVYRYRDGQDMLIISGTILRTIESTNLGILNWSIPMTEANIPQATRVLAALGWDGRLWPHDGGWPHPTNNEDEATGLQFVLRDMKLSQALVFPPDAVRGNRVLKFVLGHRDQFFPMPMTLSPEDVVETPPAFEARLRELLADVTVFQPREVDAQ